MSLGERAASCRTIQDAGDSVMVMMTVHAATAIQSLTRRPDAPRGAGLRIARDDRHGSLRLSVTACPAEGDAVVEFAGAWLFLDSEAASALEEKALDAQTSDGQVRFTIVESLG